MHWKSRGRGKKTVKKLWKKAVTGDRFRKGLAETRQKVRNDGKIKKKIVVWVKLQKSIADKDIVGTEITAQDGGDESLRGEKPLELGKSFKTALGKGC